VIHRPARPHLRRMIEQNDRGRPRATACAKESSIMMIHEISNLVERYKDRKRVGRGRGSGMGKTSGRGHKGAKSRSGWSTKLAREGGQLPYFRRIPKRGFSNKAFATTFAIVNVRDLEKHFNAGDTVNAESLIAKGLIRDTDLPIKVLGCGDLTKKLSIAAGKVSASAQEKIEKAGGTVTLSMKETWARSEPTAAKTKNRAKK